MKVYFAGSIRGGRDLQPIYKEIVETLQTLGHEVLSAHVADPNILNEGETGLTDEQIYKRDTDWIWESQLVIAEITNPSLGVGYEISYAYNVTACPIICFYQEDIKPSAMIIGCGCSCYSYHDKEDLCEKIRRYIGEIHVRK